MIKMGLTPDDRETLRDVLTVLLCFGIIVLAMQLQCDISSDEVANTCISSVRDVPPLPELEEDDEMAVVIGNGEGSPLSDTYGQIVGALIPAISGSSGNVKAKSGGIIRPWPATLTLDMDLDPTAVPWIYVTCNNGLEAHRISVFFESHPAGTASAAIYDDGHNLIGYSNEYAISAGYGWETFPLEMQPTLEDGKDYWLVAYADTGMGGVMYGTEVDPPAPAVVLPLLKLSSDMAAGNSKALRGNG